MTFSFAALFSGPSRKRWAALVAGAALVLSFAPYELVWLAPLSLATLILLWDSTTSRQAFWIGYCFGLGLFTAGTYWLYISLNILGGLWPPMALLLMFGLIAVMALYVALSGSLAVWLTPAGGFLRWVIVVPASWVLMEWLRGWLFTGFPWMSVGYSQIETPLGALAPVVGVYGVSAVTVFYGGLIVSVVQEGAFVRRLTAIVVSALGLAGLLALEPVEWSVAEQKELQVTLVQGAVPQELKWLPAQLEPTLELYQRLSFEQVPRDLYIWPEAAVPAFPFEIPDFLQNLNDKLHSQGSQLFTGILTYDIERGEYRNTLWALGGEEGMYFKRHLVMFGEYFPLPDFAKRLLRIMNLPSESISAGAANQALLVVKGIPVAATICYEIAFGAEQLQFFPAAQLLVNVSNDGWFGDSIAPHQHLQIGQMRARETGRYLLRATNTGVTAVVDAQGRVISRLPQFEPGVINANVRAYSGATPYISFGNWPVVSGAVLLLLVAFLLRRYLPAASIR